MAMKRQIVKPTPGEAVRVRRSYFDCRCGQLHVRTAFPSSGGFDEHTTLVCFHASPLSSRAYAKFLPHMARDRSVYAPDTPGFGESDPPPTKPSIADYAAAMSDFLDQMRFREVDLLGYHTGALIATELAIQRPEQIRRVVLTALPIFTAQQREAFMARVNAARIEESGGHLTREWSEALARRGPGMTIEAVADYFAEKLRNGPNAWWGGSAAHQYATVERLPLLRQPVLVLRPKDHTWDLSLQARQLIRGVKLVDLPDFGFGLFDAAPALVAQQARDFLNAA
jgi:pimeloyl-ACP methyl ester carboxylesterase